MLVGLFSSEPSCPSHPCAALHPACLSLGVCGPVHGVDLGQVPTQGSSGPHLDAANNFHAGHDLRKQGERKNSPWTCRSCILPTSLPPNSIPNWRESPLEWCWLTHLHPHMPGQLCPYLSKRCVCTGFPGILEKRQEQRGQERSRVMMAIWNAGAWPRECYK